MITWRFRWAAVVGLALGLRGTAALAEDVIWRPVAPKASHPPTTARASPAPLVSLGRPVPLGDARPSSPPPNTCPTPVTTVAFSPAAPAAERGRVVRAQAPDAVPPGSGPPPVPPPASAYQSEVNPGVPINPDEGFWARCRDFLGVGGTEPSIFLHCDHAFDVLCTPVSNPFFFEDPRSLTEIRPIFIYQSVPSSNPVFRGGYAGFLGLQARVALNQSWSIVLNELGFVTLQPDDGGGLISSSTGFAEVHIGPKWTFCRHDNAGFVAATGLTFEIPCGAGGVYQDTGSLGLAPYISFAKNFGRLPYSWGSFNFMSTTGYSFGLDSQRSEFFYSSMHLDYDVANLHHFYPLVELNWFYYTKGGNRTNFGFEGADLVNFGSSGVSNQSYVTLAAGMRYKFTEACQIGGVVEFPISNDKGINDFRVTIDMIFRF